MTEQEWLNCADPTPMLEFLRGKASGRKLRFFGIACYSYRPLHPQLTEAVRHSIELAEQVAESSGALTVKNWSVAFALACQASTHAIEAGLDQAEQCDLLRCIFTPFRSVVAKPVWLTSTVVSLAQGIYTDRAFDRMPILADALQDAGCDNADILAHCRDTHATHGRGCWVVDLLTGRK